MASIKAIGLFSANAGKWNLVFLSADWAAWKIGLQQRQGMPVRKVYWQKSVFGKHDASYDSSEASFI